MAQCTATAKRSGSRCLRQAGQHVTVCKKHGAGAPQVRAAAARRAVEAAARRALTGTVYEPVDNPLAALSEIVGEVLAFKNYMADEVAVLRTVVSRDAKGTEEIRAVIAAYERGLDRSATWLVAMARLNIDERLARIEEAQMMTVIRAFEAALAQIGVSGPDALSARTVFAGKLRAV